MARYENYAEATTSNTGHVGYAETTELNERGLRANYGEAAYPEPDSQGTSEIQQLLSSLRKQSAELHEMLGVLEHRLQPVVVDRPSAGLASAAAEKQPLRSPVGSALGEHVEGLASFRWRISNLIENLSI